MAMGQQKDRPRRSPGREVGVEGGFGEARRGQDGRALGAARGYFRNLVGYFEGIDSERGLDFGSSCA